MICICGHEDTAHVEGDCKFTPPFARFPTECECMTFIELCPMCRHSIERHETGSCATILTPEGIHLGNRTDKRPGELCGCTNYPGPS